MRQNKGRLIVIDGLDGSGKSTQLELCAEHFKNIGKSCKTISFPDYSNPSSALVKMYLAGELSDNAQNVNAYAASSFYAVDRYASYKQFWESDYQNGAFILAGRYVSSNAIHQMVKLDASKWDSYLDWLEDYEYEKLSLPRPDCVIFLDMPIKASQKLLSQRYCGDENKKDIHEADVDYLKKCRQSALYAAKKYSWHIVSCANSECIPHSRQTVLEEILKIIGEIDA